MADNRARTEGGFVLPAKDGTHVKLRVSPGAKSTGIKGLYGEALKLSVAAPPVDGKANAEAERYLSRLLGLGRSGAEVVGGESSRGKLVLVRGLGPEETRTRLQALIAES